MTTLSRRRLLGAGAAVAAGSGLALAPGPASAATASLLPADPALHLLRRASYGPTPAAYEEVRRLGTTGWLDAQLAPARIRDSACTGLLSRWPRLGWSVPQVRAGIPSGGWGVMQDLGEATIARAAWSRRQLLEVMVEFWSNHLNVTSPSSEVWDSRHRYDADVVRPHALGRFADMLVASARHPAMLVYLDQASSTRDAPNENYGRELLELHTVGIGAGYTEADVRDSARALTGFGLDWASGRFTFRPWDHHVGPLRVLGWSHPNPTEGGGEAVGLAYLSYLARHPATARLLATKLCLRFVSDTPPAALVGALAATYTRHDTAIAPVLRQLFLSPEFAASTGAKVRRPYEDLVATLRLLGIAPDAQGTAGIRALSWMSAELGQQPLAWHPPNGYPDVAPAWQSAGGTRARWSMHLNLAAHWWPRELRLPPLRGLLPATPPATHGALVDALARRLLWAPLPAAQRSAVLGFLGRAAADPLRADDAALGWRLPYLVALVLDTPQFSLR